MTTAIPRIGVGVFVINPNNQFLISKRLGNNGTGTWGLSGGHLEHGETLNECGMRETKEECGIDLDNIDYLAFTENFFPNGKHYITFFMVSYLHDDQQPSVMEPDKLVEWQWVTRDTAPTPLFAPLEKMLQQNPDLKYKPKSQAA